MNTKDTTTKHFFLAGVKTARSAHHELCTEKRREHGRRATNCLNSLEIFVTIEWNRCCMCSSHSRRLLAVLLPQLLKHELISNHSNAKHSVNGIRKVSSIEFQTTSIFDNWISFIGNTLPLANAFNAIGFKCSILFRRLIQKLLLNFHLLLK